MKYDFDRVIDRRGTYSIKYTPASRGKPDDVLPLWVADMDFAAPPCVIDALVSHAQHGIFGYSEPDDGYFSVIRNWFEKRFNWSVEREWLTITPGVVTALYIAIRGLTEPGDSIVIQQPVYYPFESSIRQTGRKPLVNELSFNDGRYSVNFDDFEEKIKQAKLFVMCNPHNPVSRVWTGEELARMGEICLRHGVTVIADEIHQDFIFPGHKHLVFASLDPRFADITVTCTAPSKTFNLAGLSHANIFISNETLRGKFKQEYARCGLSQPGVMGLAACKAAYQGGDDWLEELIVYLSGNMSLIKEFLQTNIPQIKLVDPEGTYLAWLDCRALASRGEPSPSWLGGGSVNGGLGFSAQELEKLITEKCKLWLSNGRSFGRGGEGFFRMNAACPRSVLSEALQRLKKVNGD